MLEHMKRQVLKEFYNMRYLVMFITAVCLLFLLKFKWPKNKSVSIRLYNCFFFFFYKRIFLNNLSGFPCKSLYFRPELGRTVVTHHMFQLREDFSDSPIIFLESQF